MRIARTPAALAAIAAAAVAAYAPGLGNPFIYDDSSMIVENEYLASGGHLGRFFGSEISSTGAFRGHFRPLPMLTLALNRNVGGLDPRGYRAANLALHVGNALLVFLFARRLLRTFGAAPADGRAGAALFAAGLFALHPLNSLSMLLVWKRTTLLFAFFYLLAVIAYLSLRGFGAPAAPVGRRRWALGACVALSFVLALACKETALTLPAALLLLEMVPRPGHATAPGDRAPILLHAVLWLLAAAFVTLFFPKDIAAKAAMGRLDYLFAETRVFWLYVAMIVRPGLLAAGYDTTLPSSLREPTVIAAGLGILALGAVAVWQVRRRPLISLAVAWIFVALAPTSSVVPGPLLVDEDRTYVPFILVWTLAAASFARWGTSRWRPAVLSLAGLVLLGAGAATLVRAAAWSDPLWVWADALAKSPRSLVARGNLCSLLSAEAGREREATAACSAALEMNPALGLAVEGLARALVRTGRLDDAEAAVTVGLRSGGDDWRMHRAAGHLAWVRDRPARAAANYRDALGRNPLDRTSRLFLADCQVALGDVAGACGIFQALRPQADEDPSTLDVVRRLAARCGL